MSSKKSKPSPPTTAAEAQFWVQGLPYIAGLDEAGRGAWAGPVYAAAVILSQSRTELAHLAGVRDSKTLSAAQRERLSAHIRAVAIAVATGRAEAVEIDMLGIVPATQLAMRRALRALSTVPNALVIDALRLPTVDLPQDAFPHADARSLSVASAGIIAKVARDRWMCAVAAQHFPGYHFAQHKGYGTKKHRAALDRLGICAIHRRSFRPIAERVSE